RAVVLAPVLRAGQDAEQVHHVVLGIALDVEEDLRVRAPELERALPARLARLEYLRLGHELLCRGQRDLHPARDHERIAGGELRERPDALLPEDRGGPALETVGQ